MTFFRIYFVIWHKEKYVHAKLFKNGSEFRRKRRATFLFRLTMTNNIILKYNK